MEIDIAIDLMVSPMTAEQTYFRCVPRLCRSTIGLSRYNGGRIHRLLDCRPIVYLHRNRQNTFLRRLFIYQTATRLMIVSVRYLGQDVYTCGSRATEDEFVFCCFNNNYKITPEVFDCWMKILKQVNGSVLWLFEDNAKAASNLQKEAKNRGVNPERLIFAKRMPLSRTSSTASLS